MNRYNELSKDTQAGVDALINSLASNLDYRDQMLSAATWAAKEVERSMDDEHNRAALKRNHAILDHMRAAQWPFRGVRHGR